MAPVVSADRSHKHRARDFQGADHIGPMPLCKVTACACKHIGQALSCIFSGPLQVIATCTCKAYIARYCQAAGRGRGLTAMTLYPLHMPLHPNLLQEKVSCF